MRALASVIPWKTRKALGLLAAIAGVACLLGLATYRDVPGHALPAITITNSLLNVLALMAIFLRCLHWPAERRGWMLIGLATVLGVTGQLLLGWMRYGFSLQSQVTGWYSPLNLAVSLLQVWAILSWPWRPSYSHHQLLDALGSLLFAASLFLLFWVLGVWQPWSQRDTVMPLLVFTRATRVAMVGGVAMYVILQAPRRLLGALGLILGGIILGHGGTLLTVLKLEAGTLHHGVPWLAFPLVFPMTLVLAALTDGPVDPRTPDSDPHPMAGLVLFMYIPFALASALLALLILRSRSNLTWPLLAFLGVTGILIIRQYLFMREAQETSLKLEENERSLRAHAEDLNVSNQALRLANEEKDCLFGIVSHDLRNPLSAVILATELIKEEEDLRACRDLAGKVHGEAMAMAGLVSRFLDLATMEAGRLRPSPETVTLKPELLKLVERHQAHATEKNITWEVALGHLPDTGWVDPKFLQGVLDNLMSNAVKFSPKGSVVGFSASCHEAMLWIEVRDQGPGFTKEDRSRLFGRFARLSAKPTGGEKSSGLGLSIVKHMVDAMGGRIEVESTPGHGAAFKVALPLAHS